jgi:hypothetical protein
MEKETSTILSLARLNFIFGIWLIISPFLLNYTSTQAQWQQVVVGIIVAVLAMVRYFNPEMTWASWINALAGIWMIITPFATNFQTTAATWNAVIFGILIAIVGASNAGMHSAGHGKHHPAM